MTGPPGIPALLVAAVERPAPELAALLGHRRTASLEGVLAARARDWAAVVAPGRVRASRGDLAAGARTAFEQLGGSVLVAWPALGHWRSEHAAAALDDLAHGCDVSIGPLFDGGLYLLALARPEPEILALLDGQRLGDVPRPGDAGAGGGAAPAGVGGAEGRAAPTGAGGAEGRAAPSGRAGLPAALDAVQGAGLAVGLLHAERGLRTVADLRAALADPMLDPELAAILRG
ncbi:MAG: hypothetical protein ACRDMX_10285 [Solirubrobacteraceae bacterium]